MNSKIRTLLLAAALTGGFLSHPLHASKPEPAPVTHQVTGIAVDGKVEIKIGTAASTVRYFMGSPLRKLEGNMWVYRGYRPVERISVGGNCDQLVVAFADGRVAGLRLMNHHAVKNLVAQSKRRSLESKAIRLTNHDGPPRRLRDR